MDLAKSEMEKKLTAIFCHLVFHSFSMLQPTLVDFPRGKERKILQIYISRLFPARPLLFSQPPTKIWGSDRKKNNDNNSDFLTSPRRMRGGGGKNKWWRPYSIFLLPQFWFPTKITLSLNYCPLPVFERNQNSFLFLGKLWVFAIFRATMFSLEKRSMSIPIYLRAIIRFHSRKLSF